MSRHLAKEHIKMELFYQDFGIIMAKGPFMLI